VDVLERIERGELKIYTAVKEVGYCPVATSDEAELLRLARLGRVDENFLRDNCKLFAQCNIFDGTNCNMKCKHRDFCRLRQGR
jgi:hypothetical protein